MFNNFNLASGELCDEGYQKYVKWCNRIRVEPAPYQKWLEVQHCISSVHGLTYVH